MKLTKRFVFHASHQLTGEISEPLHGHSYKLEVSVIGDVNSDGIVIDFHKLKSLVNSKVIEKLNHHHLNDVLDQPSAENIALWIWGELKDCPEFKLFEVKLWETDNSIVVYRGE
jgi:6-pyruvoyltetrahydropterin/6-carboxytetrahydropterin synthase